MFIMMNAARFNVGLEGLGDAERAYQRAVAYARDRIQGTELGVRGGPKVSILKHPDVRRMLMSMRSRIEAMRAIAYVTAAAQDKASAHADPAVRNEMHLANLDARRPVFEIAHFTDRIGQLGDLFDAFGHRFDPFG